MSIPQPSVASLVINEAGVGSATVNHRDLNIEMCHGFEVTRIAQVACDQWRKSSTRGDMRHDRIGGNVVARNECRDRMPRSIDPILDHALKRLGQLAANQLG